MIPKMGVGASGQQVSAGHYAITPAGHLVLIPPLAPLKPGFRWATEADIDPPKSIPVLLVEKPKAEPAPAPKADKRE